MFFLFRIKEILVITLIILGFCFESYPKDASEQELELKTFLDEADKLFGRYQYDSAIIYYDSALFIAEEMADQIMVSNILRLKGTVLRNAGKNDSAYILYYDARQKAIEIGNDSICASTDIGLGHIYEDRGILDSAEIFYRHALSDYEKMNDTVGIGRALYNLSMFYQTKIDYETSLKYALECNRIFKRYNNILLYSRSLINLGNIYEYLQEYDTALACYEECKKVNMQFNDLKRAAKVAGNKAVIYFRQDKLEEAKNEVLDAIEFNEKIKDTNELSLLYRNLSVIYKKLEMRDIALNYAHKALLMAEQADDKMLHADALLNIAVHYKQKSSYQLAENYYLQGIDTSEKYNLKWEMQNAYGNIAMLYEATGNFKKAYEYLQKYSDISETITNEDKTRAREKYKAEYELLHYKDQNRIKELEKKKIRFQRNLSYGIGATIIVLLILILYFFRMRARKNRIIAAQKIQKLEDEKKLMAAQSVLVGQEKERERIARELHDGIGVLLSTASIHFSSVEEKADKETSEMLKKANKLLKDAGKEVRQISHNMMPGVLSKFGLREAIEDLFEDVEEFGDIEIDLQVKCQKERLSENTEIMIYRVIQEMLNNTLKHANASAISLFIERTDNQIIIKYADNGDGFDVDKLPSDKSLGLSGIQSRIDYLGGTTELTSEPDKGTKYSISIPISKKPG